MPLLTLRVSVSEKTTTLAEPVDPSILTSMREGAPQSLTGVPQRQSQVNDAIPRVAPKWLKHDRQVRKSKSSAWAIAELEEVEQRRQALRRPLCRF